MNLSELRSTVRRRIRDRHAPYLWDDEEIDGNINEAEREVCVRALLIEDDSSSLTQVDVYTTEKRYKISDKIIDVISIEAASSPNVPVTGWTLNESYLIFDRFPSADDTLTMRVYRMPVSDMVSDTDEPEIRSMHHDRMLDWAISLCYLVPDTETFDQSASDRYAARFSASFGDRESAQTLRNYRDKAPKVVASNGYF